MEKRRGGSKEGSHSRQSWVQIQVAAVARGQRRVSSPSSATMGTQDTLSPLPQLLWPDAQLYLFFFFSISSFIPYLQCKHMNISAKCPHDAQGISQEMNIPQEQGKKAKVQSFKKKITLCIEEMVSEQSASNIPYFPLRAPRLF